MRIADLVVKYAAWVLAGVISARNALMEDRDAYRHSTAFVLIIASVLLSSRSAHF